jgi:hypothetical protein
LKQIAKDILKEMAVEPRIASMVKVSKHYDGPPESYIKSDLAHKMAEHIKDKMRYTVEERGEFQEPGLLRFQDDTYTHRAELIVFSPEEFNRFVARLWASATGTAVVDLDDEEGVEPKDVTQHVGHALCACSSCRYAKGGNMIQIPFLPPMEFHRLILDGDEAPGPEEMVSYETYRFELNRVATGFKHEYVYRYTLVPGQKLSVAARMKFIKEFGAIHLEPVKYQWR